MISVEKNFEPYCEKCPELKTKTSYEMLWENGEVYMTQIVVGCKHASKCKAIYKSMKGEKKEI